MTERIPLDDLTSDQLDALYDRLEAAEDAIARVMDLNVPDAATAIRPAYALGWMAALASARRVLAPAQLPVAATGLEQS